MSEVPRRPPVVLDAMGGDAAPDIALAAARTLTSTGTQVLLCGHPDVVGEDGLYAGDVVGMAEEPAFAVHQRPDVSIRVAARAVAQGRAAALVSAGSTGATVAAALLELGRLPGIRRPVIAARLPAVGPAAAADGEAAPAADRTVLLVDVGALPDADAEALVHAARLGVQHLRDSGHQAPTVGLLNVGSEPGKGDALRRQVEDLLGQLDGFIGNVEPTDLLAGRADVVVTDGFTGNLVLKTFEATLRALAPAGGPDSHRTSAAGTAPGRDGAGLLLGVRGTVLIAHGAATADDLVAAVRRADDLAGAAAVPSPSAAPPGTSMRT